MIERWGRPELTVCLLLALFVNASWLPWWATSDAWQHDVSALGVVLGVVAVVMWLAHRAQASQPEWVNWVVLVMLAGAFLLCAQPTVHPPSSVESARPSSGPTRADRPLPSRGRTVPARIGAARLEATATPSGPRGGLLAGLALLTAEGLIVAVVMRRG
ncbi:hypothetical protein [Streptoalloteichus hindustanus]|uniref:Uncharacterized protein n=1 Tax=Streptoalloteichus hindustanus TaxID=2017 RepID=A0A1M4UIY4_STRHI|nr:hypothetical protein [Streptoalloteichus hindustanus]SHE56523.1 hypothetical protein SAMN05444320_101438 [Streptoalloteichus hindustanus]